MNFDKRFLLISVIFLSFGQVNGQVTILSGPEKGSYSRFVSDMATVLGEKGGIKIINKLTAGSAYNFKVLTNPSSNDKIALIQSDYLNLMIAEDKLNNTNKAGSLKVVMQLATEEIHIITKKSSGLAKLQDLEKKKLGIGNEDQGSFATAKLIKDRSKINWYTYRVGFEEMLKKLAAGTIDAGLIVGSSPLNMLDIDPQVMVGGISLLELDDFNGWAKYYENDTIYRGEYKWLEKNVPTFGVRTLLIVNESKLTDNQVSS
jgi:TRAP transporter TAXI family solute receptor